MLELQSEDQNALQLDDWRNTIRRHPSTHAACNVLQKEAHLTFVPSYQAVMKKLLAFPCWKEHCQVIIRKICDRKKKGFLHAQSRNERRNSCAL